MTNKEIEALIFRVVKNVFTLGLPELAKFINSVRNSPAAKKRQEERKRKRALRKARRDLRDLNRGE